MAVYKTAQREMLLDYLGKHGGRAFTVRELSAEISGAGENVPSESTVYRLLRELEKSGKVHRSINPENREYVYSTVSDENPSVNVRCKVCGSVCVVDDETSRRIKEDIAGLVDLYPDGGIELVVRCKNCK